MIGFKTVQAVLGKVILFVVDLAWMLGLNDLGSISTSGALSRSNGYVGKVGGYHNDLLDIRDPLNEAPCLEKRPFLQSMAAFRALSNVVTPNITGAHSPLVGLRNGEGTHKWQFL